jgi:chemotaxis response regulator CheB
MPGLDGLACLDRIMVERPCPVVMVSSLTEEGADETLEAMALGAIDFVPSRAARCRSRSKPYAPAGREGAPRRGRGSRARPG